MGHFPQLHLNLHLAAAAYFRVVVLDSDPPVLQQHADPAPEILGDILGQCGVVPGFPGDLVPVVPRAPLGLTGVHPEPGSLRPGRVLHAIKDIEFVLRSHNHLVGNAQFLHIVNGPLGHVPRILVKGTVGGAVNDHHIPDHGQRGDLPKGVHCRGVQVGHKDHVAALNGRIAIIGTVKPNAVLHGVLVEPPHRNAEVPPPAINIGHLKVDHLYSFFLTQG